MPWGFRDSDFVTYFIVIFFYFPSIFHFIYRVCPVNFLKRPFSPPTHLQTYMFLREHVYVCVFALLCVYVYHSWCLGVCVHQQICRDHLHEYIKIIFFSKYLQHTSETHSPPHSLHEHCVTDMLTTNPGCFRTVCFYYSTKPYKVNTGMLEPDNLDTRLCTHLVYSHAKVSGLNVVPAFETDENSWWGAGT